MDSNHPISICPCIYGSNEKEFTSDNLITFDVIERGASLFKKATFVMERGWDDNETFRKLPDRSRQKCAFFIIAVVPAFYALIYNPVPFLVLPYDPLLRILPEASVIAIS